MDAIKQLLEKKRQAKEALDTGGKKYVKHSTIEDARLKRLREEEEQETLAKVCRGCPPVWSMLPTSLLRTKCCCKACVYFMPQPYLPNAGAQEEAEVWGTGAAAAAED